MFFKPGGANEMAIFNYKPTKRGLDVYKLVGKRWKLIRRMKADTVEALNDLPKAALDMLWREYGIRPPRNVAY
jgi:hypothetical protein